MRNKKRYAVVIDIYEQPFAGIKTRSLDNISEPAIKETELPF